MKDSKGFTLVEMVVVILVASVILTTTVRSFGDVGDRRAVTAAQATFEGMHARARAQAIEKGTIVELRVDGAADQVFLETASEQLEMIDFNEAYGIDLWGYPTDEVTLCMSPRGFAETTCNSFPSLGAAFFVAGDEIVWAAFLPLGQLVYPDSI
jgi:prepilin-type N-terminal cleavage/methylation domain-containing protein